VSIGRTAKRLAAVAAFAGAAFLVPAAADWLVTRDGARIETLGPWKVESRLVVFKRPDGTYASLRLSEIDLEASERLTLEMAEAAQRPEQPEGPLGHRQPVARLTEKDLPPVGPRVRAEGEPPAEIQQPSTGSTEEDRPQPLSIPTWREVTTIDDPGLAFVGEIHNPTEHLAVGITVTVTLYDAEDEEIASTAATLTNDTVPPRKNGAFRASFPGIFHYVRAHFDVSGEMVLTDQGQQDEAEGPPS
jgi:hypothetical protein